MYALSSRLLPKSVDVQTPCSTDEATSFSVNDLMMKNREFGGILSKLKPETLFGSTFSCFCDFGNFGVFCEICYRLSVNLCDGYSLRK